MKKLIALMLALLAAWPACALAEKENGLLLEEQEAAQEENRLKDAWGQAKRDMQAAREQKRQKEEALTQARKRLNEQEQSCAALASRLHVLKEMARRREGYQNSVRLLMEDAAKDPCLSEKILGVVAEKIRVPRQLEAAIATALGGAALLTGCDLLSRLLFAPYELPVGIVLSLGGGPFFLWLLLKQRGGRTP